MVAYAVIMLVAAGGMWKAQYWAVLGFEMLLALTLITLVLGLLFVKAVLGAVFLILVALPTGYLFWKLVRAMARIQMPERPQPRPPSV